MTGTTALPWHGNRTVLPPAAIAASTQSAAAQFAWQRHFKGAATD